MKHRAIIYGILLSATAACAQTNPQAPAADTPLTIPNVSPTAESSTSDAPDAPTPSAASQIDVVTVAHDSLHQTGKPSGNCNLLRSMAMVTYNPDQPGGKLPPPCAELVSPYQRFLSTKIVIPLTWQEKGYLALHQWSDPSNLMTIAGVSAINIAADSSTAYGPGMKGWATLTGVSLSQDATGEFFGTFVIPSLTHQDPRYFRLGKGSIPRRIANAVSQTYVAYGDDGHRMPNYGVILTYPIASVISNLYVPGIESNARSTTRRVAVGYALEPVNNLVTEFVPDLAKRIRIRIIFVQNILNNIAVTPAGPQP